MCREDTDGPYRAEATFEATEFWVNFGKCESESLD